MSLPEGYSIRPVKASDYQKYIEVLSVLTTVGDVSESQFRDLLDLWAANPKIYFPQVIANAQDEVVATGMILIEQKLIHGCGKVGHVEDIAVARSQQGKNLGLLLIRHLNSIAEKEGCYKIILDCSPENAGFYNKCDYKNAGVYMSKRYG
ncbi:glucosamine-phosphate N-acetyltransferase [Metschnikowia bicuspidata]|uniref:Glucosamine 6-phosphate N-acetyltransferase n=1 Tax=Metschnikowia bicuspidata TaxID=27322 RepID=A0A4V1J3K7_9ASCO|nr:glucosamine-phosphate N-acetyltransferase [Metschnikowia bicuspidata]